MGIIAAPESVVEGPMTIDTFLSLMSLVAESTALVAFVWSSSMKTSSCFPNRPPCLLMSSAIARTPSLWRVPRKPPVPVMLKTAPILMVSAAEATGSKTGGGEKDEKSERNEKDDLKKD
jgi:hypothetical protein